MLCMMLGVAAGCAEPSAPSTTDTAPAASEQAMAADAVLVKFTCPSMH